MKEKLLAMFPGGQWGKDEKTWDIKHGCYILPVADIVDGEMVLTNLGRQLLAVEVEEVVTVEVEAVVIPEFTALKPAPTKEKKTGLKV